MLNLVVFGFTWLVFAHADTLLLSSSSKISDTSALSPLVTSWALTKSIASSLPKTLHLLQLSTTPAQVNPIDQQLSITLHLWTPSIEEATSIVHTIFHLPRNFTFSMISGRSTTPVFPMATPTPVQYTTILPRDALVLEKLEQDFVRQGEKWDIQVTSEHQWSDLETTYEFLRSSETEMQMTVLQERRLECPQECSFQIQPPNDEQEHQLFYRQRENETMDRVTEAASMKTWQVHHPQRLTKQVTSEIQNEGFHRQMVIQTPVEMIAKCQYLVLQPMLASMYLDLDELRQLQRLQKFKLYAFTNHIDVEKPEYVSSQHTVLLQFSGTQELRYPIHFRYQAPSEEDQYYRTTQVLSPVVYSQCSASYSEALSIPAELIDKIPALAQSLMSWHKLETMSSPLVVEIPIGRRLDGPIVSFMTIAITVLGAVVLILTVTMKQFKPTAARKNRWWYQPQSRGKTRTE